MALRRGSDRDARAQGRLSKSGERRYKIKLTANSWIALCLLIALAAASLPGWIYFLLVALIRIHFRDRRSCRRCTSDASYESVGNA
jgi:hypothetical protein